MISASCTLMEDMKMDLSEREKMMFRVSRGVGKLSSIDDVWHACITVSCLNMYDARYCVIGQWAYSRGMTYIQALARLGIKLEQLEDYGFTLPMSTRHTPRDRSGEWNLLTLAWKEAIAYFYADE